MPYITSIERMAREEGRTEGRAEERQKLHAERQKLHAERRRELIDHLTQVLAHRFGDQVNTCREHVEQADIETLRTWINQAFSVPDLLTLFDQGHS